MKKELAEEISCEEHERARLILSSRRWFWASTPFFIGAIFISNYLYWPAATTIGISFWQYYKATRPKP